MKINLHGLFKDWFYVWALALCCFGVGATYGGRVLVALHQNLHLNDVVTWYGRGNGNIQQYYLSTLIVFSACWMFGGIAFLAAGWIYNRKQSKKVL